MKEFSLILFKLQCLSSQRETDRVERVLTEIRFKLQRLRLVREREKEIVLRQFSLIHFQLQRLRKKERVRKSVV